jgi:thiol-disulfide isomerase/thioredoxin
MRKILVFLFTLFLPATVFCQVKNNHEISLTISGLSDSSVYLAYHFGNKQYLTDTARLDGKGRGVFKGDEKLEQGIYMIVLPGNKYFEFLASDDQVFSVTCDYDNYYETLKFNGSDENTAFVDYQKRWTSLQRQAQSISRRIQNNRQNNDSLRLLTEKQKDQEEAMKSYLRNTAEKYGGSLLSVLVNSMLPVEVPDFQIAEGTHNPDSARWVLRYNYNKDHFFDNLDLTDERLLRTPLLYARLDAFFRNVVIQHPDSINKEIDRIINKCEDNYNVFQFVSVYLFNHFRESEIMGHDAVILKLADDIYLSGKADWITNDFRDDLARQAELIRNNLIGMKAKNLVMDSYNGIFVSLYDIEKDFTILYFWEPNCGYCKEVTPKLRDFYEQSKEKGIEVFAICTIDDKEQWSEYIEKYELRWINGWDPERLTHFDFYYNVQATPMIYILDRDKTIIAKKISVDDISSFIDNYRKYNM